MMNSAHHEDDVNIVGYAEDEAEMEEFQVSAVSHDFKYDDDEHTDGDEYGGMSPDIYNDIVTFKKSDNTKYPSHLNSRQDRSALSHWRARCLRYVMATDNETLMYCNQASSVSDAPKVVVKKGEVRRVIERVHELIGHLGQKRTQMAVLKKLHWRSVRQDVKTYILSCDFCNQKKLDGKKILKAPVDISSDNFGFTVEARFGPNIPEGERLQISLVGYNEHEVQAAAMTRMTSYTFKETVSDLRGGRYGRTLKPEFLAAGSSVAFRRQPYIRRSRYTPYSSFILPYTPKGPKEEPEFIIYNPNRGEAANYPAEEYEVEETMVVDGQEQMHVIAPDHLGDGVDSRQAMQAHVKDEMIMFETQHQTKPGVPTGSSMAAARKERFARPQAAGIASRFSFSIGPTEHFAQNSDHLLSSMEAVQNRAEIVGLAPIMMMPSADSDVVALQKELLTRQLHIQELQEKVLQRQLEDDRIARYEQIDPQAGRMQLLEDSAEAVIEDLNVMDSGEDEEIIKQYQRR